MPVKIERYQPTTGDIPGFDRIEGLEADVDLRLMEIYPELARRAKERGWDLEEILPFLRAAYADGRSDERSADPDPDRIYKSHGLKIPPRRTTQE